jgi:tetratricopeptide (TPR) repeat protein
VAKIPSLNSFSLRALVKTAQGKDNEAIQNFQSAIAVEDAGESGSSAKVRTLWGKFYVQRGKLEEARQLYDEALRILPRYPLALINLAELETSLGNYQAAENHYSSVFVSAAYSSTYDHIAWYGRSQLKKLQGDRVAAEAYWQKAKSLLDQHQNLNGFGHRREVAKLLLARANPADLTEALSLMQSELKIRRDLQTLDLYANILIELKRWQEAENIISEALNLGTRSDVLYYRAALIAQGLGDLTKAAKFRQKAKDINPTFEPKFYDRSPKFVEQSSN